jgi:ribonuclease P protein component
MLNKKQRIPIEMFPLLKKGANVFRSDLFLLRFVPSKEANSRFCFSVSKKITKKAVIRNKNRRWGYSEIAKFIPEINKSVVAVFSYNKTPTKKEEVFSNLEYLLKKAKLIK